MLICHIPYQRVVLAFVFGILATQMAFTTFALFCSHVAGVGTHISYLLLATMLSSSAATPLWHLVLLRIGKRATVMIGLSMYVPALIVIGSVPSNFPVFVSMCIVSGFGTGALSLLPWSMLPDVVDDFAVRHPSCRDMEPLFFSCYAFCNKLAGGLASGISTLTLQFVGYRSGACHHGDAVVTALTVLTTLVPVVLLLVAVGFFWFYPIDERQLYKPPTPEDTAPPSSSSSPASPASDLREAVEQPTDQQPLAEDVASDSQNNTKSSVSACSNSS
ncbi:hypothetical protein INR49_003505 [Caranx melampygus]|nr:hypothetical protein INR49_003505 [Caranx melampygus]